MWRVGQCWAVHKSWTEHLPSLPWAPAHLELFSCPHFCGLWTWPRQRMLSHGIPSWGSLLPHLYAEEEPWSCPPGHEHCVVCPDLPGPVAHQLQCQPDFFPC